MSSFYVVADACVLIPAALRDTLLRAAAAGMYRVHWSEDILNEVQLNLAELGMTTPDKAERLTSVMQQQFPEALIRADQYRSLLPAMTNNAKDRHVLAAAVIAGAQVIVTSNLKHFPEKALAPFGIEAQSPDEFLSNLVDLDGRLMEQIIRSQAQDLHQPPMTVDDVLAMIEQSAPEFALAMRARTSSRLGEFEIPLAC